MDTNYKYKNNYYYNKKYNLTSSNPNYSKISHPNVNYYNQNTHFSNYYKTRGVEMYFPNTMSMIPVQLEDQVNYEVDDLFNESSGSTKYCMPPTLAPVSSFVDEKGNPIPPYPSHVTNIQCDNIKVEQYSNNDELDFELAEYWDSFLQEVAYEESIENLNKTVEHNRLFQLKFMHLSRRVKNNNRLIYMLTFHSPMSSTKPIEVILNQSIKDRELCRILNIYHDFTKSVPYVNRIYYQHFYSRLVKINSNHNYKHFPSESDNFNCNFHVDDTLDQIKITMTKQLKNTDIRGVSAMDKTKNNLKRKIDCLLHDKDSFNKDKKIKIKKEHKNTNKEYKSLFTLQDSDRIRHIEHENPDGYSQKHKLINLIYATYYNKFIKIKHMFIYNRPNNCYSILFDDYERSKIRKTILSFSDYSTLKDAKLCFLYNKYLFMYIEYVKEYDEEYIRKLHKYIQNHNKKFLYDTRLYDNSSEKIIELGKHYDNKKIEKIFEYINNGLMSRKIQKCKYVVTKKIKNLTYYYFRIKFKNKKAKNKLILIDFDESKQNRSKIAMFYISYVYKLFYFNLICGLHQVYIDQVSFHLKDTLQISYEFNVTSSYNSEYMKNKYRDGPGRSGKGTGKRHSKHLSARDFTAVMNKMDAEPKLLKLRYLNLPLESKETRKPVYYRIQNKQVNHNLGYIVPTNMTRGAQMFVLLNYLKVYTDTVTDDISDIYYNILFHKIVEMSVKYQFDYRCYNSTLDQVEYLELNDNVEHDINYIEQVYKNNHQFSFDQFKQLKFKSEGHYITILYKKEVIYKYFEGKLNFTNLVFKYISYLIDSEIIDISVFTRHDQLYEMMKKPSITAFYNLLINFEKKDADRISRAGNKNKKSGKSEICFEDLKEAIETNTFKKNKYLSYEKIRQRFAIYFAYYPERFKKHVYRTQSFESISQKDIMDIYKIYHDYLKFFKIASDAVLCKMQEIYQEPVGENGYYLSDPETLTLKNKGARGPNTPKVKKEKVQGEKKVRGRPRLKHSSNKIPKVKKEPKEKVKKEEPGIRGVVKFEIAKNNIQHTLSNNLFEKVNLIMRVKNTFYFSVQRADMKQKIKMLRHSGDLSGFRLYKLIKHYITILGKYSIFKEDEIGQLSYMLDKFYTDNNFSDIDYTTRQFENQLYNEFKNKASKGLQNAKIYNLNFLKKKSFIVNDHTYTSYRIKFFDQDQGWVSKSLALLRQDNPQINSVKLMYLKYYYWLILYGVLSKKLTKFIKYQLSINYDIDRVITANNEIPKESMRGKSYDENIIINLIDETVKTNTFRKLRYSYVITMPNFCFVEFTHGQHKKRLLKFNKLEDLVGDRLAIFLDGYITMAEASKAFSEDTLLKLRNKIDNFTRDFSFEQIEAEDKKFGEIITKLFEVSLENNFLEPKIPYTHHYKNVIRFCVINKNHNLKYKLAKDVNENDQVTGQKLYDILSKYLDCLKSIEKVSEEQATTFKESLEEFRHKYGLTEYQGLNTEKEDVKIKKEDEEGKKPYDVFDQMEAALRTRTFIKLRYTHIAHHSVKFICKTDRTHSKTIYHGQADEIVESKLYAFYKAYYDNCKTFKIYSQEVLQKLEELLEDTKSDYKVSDDNTGDVSTKEKTLRPQRNYDELFENVMTGVEASIESEVLQKLNYLYKNNQANKYVVAITNKDVNTRKSYKLISNESGLGLAKILIFYYEFFKAINLFSEHNMNKLHKIIYDYYQKYTLYDVQNKQFYKNSFTDVKKSYNAIKRNKIYMTQYMKRIKTDEDHFIYFFRIYELELGYVRHNLYYLSSTPTLNEITELYNKYYSYVNLYGLETKAHNRLDAISPSAKKSEVEEREDLVIESIITCIKNASETNKFSKCKYLNVVNAKGKIYVNFLVTINKKKDEVKLLQVSSIDKVQNDKLCFVYNKYLYLLMQKKILSPEAEDKIKNAVSELNINHQFNMIDIKIDEKSIEIKLDFDMSLGWYDYETFYNKSKDFYRTYYEIKYSLDIQEFIRCKHLSYSKTNLKFNVKNKTHNINENLGFSEDELENSTKHTLKNVYLKYAQILKENNFYPKDYMDKLFELLEQEHENSGIKTQVKEEI